jgi:hypothetical protein
MSITAMSGRSELAIWTASSAVLAIPTTANPAFHLKDDEIVVLYQQNSWPSQNVLRAAIGGFGWHGDLASVAHGLVAVSGQRL